MVKTNNTSASVAEKNNLPGRAYFIRHGESTSNERNIFAGVLDVDLTAFGRLQARRAGVDIKKKGVKFDAVYVSHMRRARQTCEIALAESQALKSPDIPVEIDHRISEKSFGIFAGRNLNLLRLALGYEGFEEMLHPHWRCTSGWREDCTSLRTRCFFLRRAGCTALKTGRNCFSSVPPICIGASSTLFK